MYSKSGRHHAVRETQRLVDGFTRDEAFVRYKTRIILVARRLARRLPDSCELDLDDLVSFGAIGLLEAFDRFDEDRGILFSTYAEYRIRGAMMDALRQTDSFSRYRRDLSNQMKNASTELTGDLGRPPHPEEMAQKLGMDLEDFWAAQERTRPVSFVSLDLQIDPEGGDGGRKLQEVIASGDGMDAFRGVLGTQTRTALRDAIEALSERPRQCVLLYYGRGMNLTEISRVFDVTPSRISQILSGARRTLRDVLSDQLGASDLTVPDQSPMLEAR